MSSPASTRPAPKAPLTRRLPGLVVAVLCFVALSAGSRAQRLRIATPADDLASVQRASPSGELPGSQPLRLTVRLGPSAIQAAALADLLLAQTTPGSPDFHRWLTPEQFRQRFGWTDAERQRLVDWLAADGLVLDSTNSQLARLSFRAPASAAERAFSVSLRFQPDRQGNVRFLNQANATLPATFAAHIQSVSGLDNFPGALAGRLMPQAASAVSMDTAADLLASLEDTVNSNLSPVLVLSSTLCASQLSAAERTDFHHALQQAQAQGITVLVEGSCGVTQAPTSDPDHDYAQDQTQETVREQASDQAFPSALAEVTAVSSSTSTPGVPTLPAGAEQRPSWQAANGLPADQLRHAPDFAVASVAALVNTVRTLVAETGSRIGSLSPTLYALQKTPDLFRHAQTSATDWTQADGLGTLDLETLLKVYPRGIVATTTALVSSSYVVRYGDPFTLTATVLPASYGATSPTGTVTFSSPTQGVIGSAAVDSTGTATLTPIALPVGSYNVLASYSGDGSYGPSASTSSKVQLTISIVNATVTAILAPAANVPYGATATVTATVSLPGANAVPGGTVTAQIAGMTASSSSAVLSPNAGGNTATANIVLAVPPPSTTPYTVQVSCLGNLNYQCQTPAMLPLTTSKGFTTTTVAVSPAAPQAGQPVSVAATVTNAGNGTGSYTFSGSVSFYDSGKLVATAPVGTNQATAMLTLSGNRTHNIVGIYSGDANWTTSTSGPQAVSPTILPDTLTLSSNVASGTSLSGVNIIFNAAASSTITYGTGPTGTVTFYDTFNSAVVALGNPAAVVANGPTAGVAVLSTTGLLPGTHRIYAVYSGDANYAPATSAVLTLSLADFGLTMTPATLVMKQGKTQQVATLINASGGFTGSVSLGCVPPSSSQATCSFSPSAVPGGGTAILTIATSAPGTALSRPQDQRLWPAASGASLALLLLLIPPVRSRRLPILFTLLFASGLSLSSLGCALQSVQTAVNPAQGNGSSGSTTDTSGTPLGTQSFTITAAASDGVNTVRHTLQYQVTVQ